MDNITVQEVNPAELPDVSAYEAALRAIEPAKRFGTVILPKFKSADPLEPVNIRFKPVAGQFEPIPFTGSGLSCTLNFKAKNKEEILPGPGAAQWTVKLDADVATVAQERGLFT